MSKPVVVVVEQDPATSDLMAEVLGCEGFAALCYPSWLVSVACIDHARPDLLILDLGYCDAYQMLLLLEQLRRHPATHALPIIVNSTDQQLLNQFSETLHQLGCTTLAKPFGLDELLEKIGACMSGGRSAASPESDRWRAN